MTVDDSGRAQGFDTSSFAANEHRRMANSPDGPRSFERFRDLPGTLRMRDRG
jgi:hypothetical protein